MSSESELKAKLSDQWWRLNNLYWVIDKKGQRVKFRLNWAQKYLYNNMWFLSIILKARQLGFTTFIQIYMLDTCLFTPNISAGVIAHNREDAEDFFTKKIKYAFDNLPEALRESLRGTSDSAKKLAFSNGSSIRVGTSLRSGTYQMLHVSEFGKICAKFPDKAEEIITGALNTVEAGQFIFIESTAEGAYGRFYEMAVEAMNFAGELTKLDYKFFFFPWWKEPQYTLNEPVDISEEDSLYFSELEAQGITLSASQKAWYAKKRAVQRSKMQQEYPSTPKEAFCRISEHAVYGAEMRKVREEGRIMSLPYNPGKPVVAFFDLGRSKTDATSIWFMQDNNPWHDLIDFYQAYKKPVPHYAKLMQEKPYVISCIYLPHDGAHDDFQLKTYEDHLRDLGFNNIVIVPKIAHYKDGIDAMRNFLPSCRFDETNCEEGILSLESYQYEYDEKDGVYKMPRHNWASHAESALRQAATGYKGQNAGWAGHFDQQDRGRRRRSQTIWGSEDKSWVV